MTKLQTISILAALSHALYATEIAVPTPSEMLSSADAVAVAKLSKKEGVWTVVFKEVLKGGYHQGDTVSLSSPYNEEAFSFDYLARLVGSSDFLFVGKQDPLSRTLQPTYGLCSVWPQGTVKELLPERTLADAISSAKTSLGLPIQKPATKASETPKPSQSIQPNNTPQSGLQPPPPLPTLKPAPTPKALEGKPSQPSDESTSSTPWSVMAVLVVAAIGLLWLLLKGRK
jgi:hypothetical protein